MPVHLYGLAADMTEILDLARDHGLVVVEDAAESLGVFVNDIHTGTRGDYGVFSFFANKTVTCGEGGVIITNEEDRYRKLCRLKNHGRDQRGTFIHQEVGYNFSFTDLQAAVGVAQMQKFEELARAKRENYEYYMRELGGIEGIRIVEVPPEIRSNHWFVNVVVDRPEELSEHLLGDGIGSRRYFYPMHSQPCFSGMQHGEFPVSDWWYEHGLSLPSGAGLTNVERRAVCDSVRRFFSVASL